MKNKLKKVKIVEEFKKFIMRGNIVDMAVGVIIGSAFGAIVTSLVNKIFMPLINLIVFACTGGNGISLITILNGEKYLAEDGVTVNPKCIFIDWGNFIQVVINFLIIAIILFAIVKITNSVHNKLHEKEIKLQEEAAVKKAQEQKIENDARLANEKLALEKQEALDKAQLDQVKLLEQIKTLLEKK